MPREHLFGYIMAKRNYFLMKCFVLDIPMSASLLKQQSIDRLVDRLEHIFPETDWFGVNIERHVNFCFSQLALNSTQFAILCKRNIIIKLFL